MKSGRFRRVVGLSVFVAVSGTCAAIPAWHIMRSGATIEQAKLAIHRGDLERAAELLDRLTRHKGGDAEAHLLAAQVAAQRKDLKASLEHLDAIPEGDPLRPAALLRQGQCLREMEYGRKAEEAWRLAVRLEPQTSAARWELLELYYLEYRLHDAQTLAWEVYDGEHDKIPALLVMLRFELARPAPHFAVETVEDDVLVAYAEKKLRDKKVDLVVANRAADSFGASTNRATFVGEDAATALSVMSKIDLADHILDRVRDLSQKRGILPC